MSHPPHPPSPAIQYSKGERGGAPDSTVRKSVHPNGGGFLSQESTFIAMLFESLELYRIRAGSARLFGHVQGCVLGKI